MTDQLVKQIIYRLGNTKQMIPLSDLFHHFLKKHYLMYVLNVRCCISLNELCFYTRESDLVSHHSYNLPLCLFR